MIKIFFSKIFCPFVLFVGFTVIPAEAISCGINFNSETTSCANAGGTFEIFNCGPFGLGHIYPICIVHCGGDGGGCVAASYRIGSGIEAGCGVISVPAKYSFVSYDPYPNGYSCPNGVTPPPLATQILTSLNSNTCGSVINTNAQNVSESIPVVGAPFSLTYTSNRVSGYNGWWQVSLAYTGDSYVASGTVSNINVTVSGSDSAFALNTNLTPPTTPGAHSITYNLPRQISSGTAVTQTQSISATITPTVSGISIMQPGLSYPTANTYYAGPGYSPSVLVGAPPLTDNGFGSWDINIHHHYDPVRQVLFFGDGSTQNVPVTALSDGTYQVVSLDSEEVYIFDTNYKHIKTKSKLSGFTKYSFIYDTSTKPRLLSVIDRDNNTTTMSYSSIGLNKITSPFGQVTSIALDSSQNLKTVTNPASETYTMTYYAGGLLHTFKKPSGFLSTMVYDSSGRLTTDSSSSGSSTTLSSIFSSAGLPSVTETSATGKVSTHLVTQNGTTYYRADNFADGKTANITESPTNQTSYDNVGNSHSESFGPDARFGTAVKYVANSSTSEGRSYSFSQTTDPSPLSDPFTFTSLTSTRTYLSAITKNVFTSSSKKLVTTSAEGRISTQVLDSKERVLSSQFASFTPTTFTYDTHGRIAAVAQGTFRTSIFSYNASGLLSSIKNALSQVTSFTYDLAGRVLTQILPDSRLVKYTYDSDGNLASISPPGKAAHTLSHNGYGFLASYFAPKPVPSATPDLGTFFTYNNDRQISHITRPNGAGITFNYDSIKGTLLNITNSIGSSNFTYGNNGNLATATSEDSIVRTFSYNGIHIATDSNATGNSPYSSVSYAYNTKLISSDTVTSNGTTTGTVINYTYDNDDVLTSAGAEIVTNASLTGFPVKASIGSNQKINYTYSSTLGELSQIQSVYGSTVAYQEDLIRDNLGRISSRKDAYGPSVNTYVYAYDRAGRLTDVHLNGSVFNHFVYDTNSNRTSQTVSGSTKSATYDGQDRLLTFGSLSFTYNLNGEMLTKTNSSPSGSQSYAYDTLGNVVKVTLPSGTVITYKLDANGRRFSRMSGANVTNIFVYDQFDRIIATLSSSGPITARYVYGVRSNVPDYVIKGSNTYQIISDHLGSPVKVIDVSTGTAIQEIHYDVWGAVQSDTNPGFTPFGFAGGLYDQDTKITHFGAREYDASIGRWLSKDPILFNGGDTNLYGYVTSDPVNFVDPSGLLVNDQTTGGLPKFILNSPLYRTLNARPEVITVKSDFGLKAAGVTTPVSGGQLIRVNPLNQLNSDDYNDTILHEFNHGYQNIITNNNFSMGARGREIFDTNVLLPGVLNSNGLNGCGR